MLNLGSKIIQTLLDLFFFHEDQSLYLNEIVRLTGADKRNLVKKLKELEKKGLFIAEKRGNLKLYSLNKEFPLYNEYKKIISSSFGFDKKLKEALKHIKGINKVYIFGSYAKNKTDTSSDIDVLIIGNHDIIKVHKQLAKLQKKYDREINAINISADEFKEKQSDPFIANIMKNEKIEII